MKVRLFIKRGLLGEAVEHYDLECDKNETARDLRDLFEDRLPKSVPIDVAVDGKLLRTDDELDAPLRDRQEVVVLPVTGGDALVAFLINVLIQIIVAVATYYVTQALAPRPKPPGIDQERGDDSSATYAWDGMKTTYGPGLPIPFIYGYHAVPMQGIWTDAFASRTAGQPLDDRLRLILSLGEGPIFEIGGKSGNLDNMGGITGTPGATIPAGITINGNLLETINPLPGAIASIRMGTQDQPSLAPPFSGVRQLFTVNEILPEQGGSVVFTFSDAVAIDYVALVFYLPQGLYSQPPTGGQIAAGVSGTARWRPQGSAAWNALGPYVISGLFVGAHAFTQAYFNQYPTLGIPIIIFPPGTKGPIEIEVTRVSQPISTTVVSFCLLRDVIVGSPHTLRYPMEALLGLEIQAGARFSGGLPQVTVPAKGALVRVWDATNGWSPRCWNVPDAPFNFHANPPGRNCAWVAVDYLLARWGLGNYLTEIDIDLPAFRRWAINCDRDPNPGDPWGEPSFTVDLVGDRPRPAWEWFMTICAAGRATPVMRGGKISVVYQYRDAHSDSGVSVPAKTPTQLITSGNCENVQVRWLPTVNRPTVYQFQFLDEAKNWTQDVLPVEDDGGTLNVPSAAGKEQYRPEVIQGYGVTRASQHFREGIWRHRIGRLVRREISFTIGPWGLAAEVGDLIDFEHEMLRPFAADVPISMQVIASNGGDPLIITVDHALSGSGLQVVVRDPDGKPQRANIASYVNAGQTSAMTLATQVTVKVGATCVVGKVDKLTETYEIVSITLEENLRREVRALQWTPTAYDPIDKDAWLTGGVDTVLEEQDFDTLPPAVYGITVRRMPDKSDLVRWARPGSKEGTIARVYIREVALGIWLLAGSTEDSELSVRGLKIGIPYQVSICMENVNGDPVPADLGDLFTFTPEEFAPQQLPALTNTRANLLDEDELVEWDELAQVDVEFFEVRCGTNWAAGTVVARARASRAVLSNPPAGPQFMLATRTMSGMYGVIAKVTNPNWIPLYTGQVLNEDDLAPSPAGTHTDTVWNSTDLVIELAAGKLVGTYESLAQDIGYQAPFYWQVRIDREEFEDLLVSEMDFVLGSGESMWRMVSGRPASPALPGIDWRVPVTAFDVPVMDLPTTLMSRGNLGVVGSHTQAFLESRFEVDGAWTPYAPHLDRIVVARKIQLRISFGRRTLKYRARVRTLTYAAFL